MRLLYITFLFSLFLGLSFIYLEIILKLVDEMNKVHIGFCMFIPIMLMVWYLSAGLIFRTINRQFKIIKFSKNADT